MIEHYISIVSHRASLSRQHKGMERSPDHTLPRLLEVHRTNASVFQTCPYHYAHK